MGTIAAPSTDRNGAVTVAIVGARLVEDARVAPGVARLLRNTARDGTAHDLDAAVVWAATQLEELVGGDPARVAVAIGVLRARAEGRCDPAVVDAAEVVVSRGPHRIGRAAVDLRGSTGHRDATGRAAPEDGPP